MAAPVIEPKVKISLIDAISNQLRKIAQNIGNMDNSLQKLSRSGTMASATFSDVAKYATTLKSAYLSVEFVASSVNQMVMSGWNLGKSLETAQVSIAGVLQSMTTLHGRQLQWNEATQVSAQVISRLQARAMVTTLTMEELTDTFRGLVGIGLGAKMTLPQIEKFVEVASLAVKSFGLPKNQMIQELRDILQGSVTARASQLATALQISNSDIKKWREMGTVFENVMERMKFADAIKASQKTVQGSTDIVIGALQKIIADGFEPLRKSIIDTNHELFAMFVTDPQSAYPQFKESATAPIKEVLSLVDDLFNSIKQIAKTFAPVAEDIGGGIMQILKMFTNTAPGIALGFAAWKLWTHATNVELQKSIDIYAAISQKANEVVAAEQKRTQAQKTIKEFLKMGQGKGLMDYIKQVEKATPKANLQQEIDIYAEISAKAKELGEAEQKRLTTASAKAKELEKIEQKRLTIVKETATAHTELQKGVEIYNTVLKSVNGVVAAEQKRLEILKETKELQKLRTGGSVADYLNVTAEKARKDNLARWEKVQSKWGAAINSANNNAPEQPIEETAVAYRNEFQKLGLGKIEAYEQVIRQIKAVKASGGGEKGFNAMVAGLEKIKEQIPIATELKQKWQDFYKNAISPANEELLKLGISAEKTHKLMLKVVDTVKAQGFDIGNKMLDTAVATAKLQSQEKAAEEAARATKEAERIARQSQEKTRAAEEAERISRQSQEYENKIKETALRYQQEFQKAGLSEAEAYQRITKALYDAKTSGFDGMVASLEKFKAQIPIAQKMKTEWDNFYKNSIAPANIELQKLGISVERTMELMLKAADIAEKYGFEVAEQYVKESVLEAQRTAAINKHIAKMNTFNKWVARAESGLMGFGMAASVAGELLENDLISNFGRWASQLSMLTMGFRSLWTAIGGPATIAVTAVTATISAIIDALSTRAKERGFTLTEEIKSYYMTKEELEALKASKKTKKATNPINEGDLMTKYNKKAEADKVAAQQVKLAEDAKKIAADLTSKMARRTMTKKEIAIADLNKEIAEFERRITTLKESGVDVTELQEQLKDYSEEAREQIAENFDYLTIHWDKVRTHIIDSQVSVTSAFNSGISSMFNTFSNFGQNMITETKSVTDRMRDLAKNLANDILNMLWKIAMQALITKAIAGLGGLFGGGGNVISGGVKMEAISSPVPTFNSGDTFSGVLGDTKLFAEGGYARGPAIVGENGAEYIDFKTPGRVYSNRELGEALKSGGGSNINIKFNLVNQSNVPVQAEQGETKFDGENYITTVILKAIRTNKDGMRDLLKGATA